MYDDTSKDLVEGCFEGYNATVLAYGQTGSGKTYTMGTGFEMGGAKGSLSVGIIPRAIRHLFNGIQKRQDEAKENGTKVPEFKVSAQFMELYNEEIIDLFDNNASQVKAGKKSGVRIHEDANGNIYTVGITSRVVMSEEDTLTCLKSGAFNRCTAALCLVCGVKDEVYSMQCAVYSMQGTVCAAVCDMQCAQKAFPIFAGPYHL